LKKIKLALAIRALDIGGAERQFLELARNIDKSKYDVTIYVMYERDLDSEAKSLEGVKFIHLAKESRYDNISFMKKYIKSLDEEQIDIVYAYLIEMNLFSLWARRFVKKDMRVVWGFRSSNMDLKKFGKFPQFLFYLQKKFSPYVDKIISNSHASVEFYKEMDYDVSKAVVIHNGINVDRFKPSSDERVAFRSKHELKDDDIAIGIVARVNHMKGYPVLAKAMQKIMSENQNVRLFAVGGGEDDIQKECEDILGEYNKKVTWFGATNSVESEFYNGLDIYVSSSIFGEGFSNSIAEAMCCEVPAVSTRVGDSHIVVGDEGIMVDGDDIDSLYLGLKEMTQMDRADLGKRARKRVVDNFSIEKMVQNTQKELEQCVES